MKITLTKENLEAIAAHHVAGLLENSHSIERCSVEYDMESGDIYAEVKLLDHSLPIPPRNAEPIFTSMRDTVSKA